MPNNIPSKYMKQELIELIGKKDRSKITVGDFSILSQQEGGDNWPNAAHSLFLNSPWAKNGFSLLMNSKEEGRGGGERKEEKEGQESSNSDPMWLKNLKFYYLVFYIKSLLTPDTDDLNNTIDYLDWIDIFRTLSKIWNLNLYRPHTLFKYKGYVHQDKALAGPKMTSQWI